MNLRIYLDFNFWLAPDVYPLRFDGVVNSGIDVRLLREGETVTVYCEDVECQAVLSKTPEGTWAATIKPNTTRNPSAKD